MWARYARFGAREAKMSKWIRQSHRWLSIIFTTTVAANFIVMAFGQPPMWIVYAPLPPLFLLMFSGLYMFALPHAMKWRTARAA
jgi:cellulose synthase/poly-beta-1,6-N-acetylglucosamine synthase-like glycosyltransferase